MMTFLHRRRSQPLVHNEKGEKQPRQPPRQPTTDSAETATTWTPARSSFTSSIGKGSPGRLIRRVSSIFSLRNKKRQNGGSTQAPPRGLCNIGVGYTHLRSRYAHPSRSPSPTDSLDEIRRPSGLGPRAGSISSNRSLPPSPCPERDDTAGGAGVYERTRAMSSPNVLSSTIFAPPSLPINNGSPRRRQFPKARTQDRIPPELVDVILSFLPLRAIPALAPTSRAFCTAARSILYSTLDTRSLRPARFNQLCALLASRHDLTSIVHTFICTVWPPSYASSSTTALAIALQGMHHLTSLTLPAFDPVLLRHTHPGLKHLMFLDHTLSPDDQADLCTWLESQKSITSLTFPNLFDKDDTNDTDILDAHSHPHTHTHTPTQPFLLPTPNTTPNSTPSPTPRSPSFPFLAHPPSPPTQHSFPFPSSAPTSLILLPNLTTLHAPPSLTILLLSPNSSPSNPKPKAKSKSKPAPPLPPLFFTPTPPTPTPLTSTILPIHTTLYTGLRPSALMAALASRGTRSLAIHFGEKLDRRTVEKVLAAAGAVLGGKEEGNKDKAKQAVKEDQVLETLEVGVAWFGVGADEALYKIIHTVLPRFRTLHTLRLFPLPSPPPASPAPGSQFGFGDTHVHMNHANTPPHTPRHIKHLPPMLPPTLTSAESANARAWAALCPSLRSVEFLSGGVWRWGGGTDDDGSESGGDVDG